MAVPNGIMPSLKALALEMVYVAEGAFYLGSGGSETYRFYKYTDGSQNTTSYQVTNEAALATGQQDGKLWATGYAPVDNSELPAAWQFSFDKSHSGSFGGVAGKVGEPYYSDDGRCFRIPVTNDFEDGDILVVGDLCLLDLALCRTGVENLALDFDGDGVSDVYDSATIQINVAWEGGSCDGWNIDIMSDYSDVARKGSLIMFR